MTTYIILDTGTMVTVFYYFHSNLTIKEMLKPQIFSIPGGNKKGVEMIS